MCEVNWPLLTGLIAAVASAANAALLFWMIRVTIRYVETNQSLLEVNRGSLSELRRQYASLMEREIRPYKNLINRVIPNLENAARRDLVSGFEDRSGVNWLSSDDLLPSDYEEILRQAMGHDVQLYESLLTAKTELYSRPATVLSQMAALARSGRSTLYPELPRLQAEFRGSLLPIISSFRSIRDNLASDLPS